MSLFKSLTDTKITKAGATEGTESSTSEDVGATALIQSLLEVTAFDACTAKRNTFATLGVISKARDLCKNIHTLAEKVDKDELLDWSSYEEYTKAIDPLEQCVQKFMYTKENN